MQFIKIDGGQKTFNVPQWYVRELVDTLNVFFKPLRSISQSHKKKYQPHSSMKSQYIY